jgi:hypothetical protein
MHARVGAIAAQRGITVSSLLNQLIEDSVQGISDDVRTVRRREEPSTERVTVRFRPGDVAIIGHRAMTRRMKPSTYIAALVRSHLVEDPPLPAAELALIERAIAEVSAVGRNLNQIARAVNAGVAAPAGTADLVRRSADAVEAVRAATKAYARKAVASWHAPLV